MIRLNRALSILGFCSRRAGDRLIQQGLVKVNGVVIEQLGYQVADTDSISVGDKTVTLQQPKVRRVWLYYKPRGLVTTHADPQKRQTVFEAVQPLLLERVVSVGRLDYNSEGLLLLTNDNQFAHLAETSGWIRRYRVRGFGKLSASDIVKIKRGVKIEGFQYAPMELQIQATERQNCWYECQLREGRNREIRRIFAHFGVEISRLIRVQYGEYCLGQLTSGAVSEGKILY